MADALTDFILKPAAPFAAGVVLFAVVWGFFKGVESVLNDDTKLEIAVWLLGVKPFGPQIEPWPGTFAKVFDRVFGTKHLSWKCFWRSSIASYVAVALTQLFVSIRTHDWLEGRGLLVVAVIAIFVNVIPDYLSLLESRLVLTVMRRHDRGPFIAVGLIAVDLLLTTAFAVVAMTVPADVFGRLMSREFGGNSDFPIGAVVSAVLDNIRHGFPYGGATWFVPAFFTSIWLWLYAGSGFLLKFGRRFDVGFDWFNRKFDIENKPLSAIGLVAGSLVAVLWWTVAVVRWVV